MTRQELYKRYKFRVSVLVKLNEGKIVRALNPNDIFHIRDVAFGMTKAKGFISAIDFKDIDMSNIGYISHIAMLQALSLVDSSKLETDIVRTREYSVTEEHYIIRGIVKHLMRDAVLFWESPHDLLENTGFYNNMVKSLRELKKRKLIDDNREVYGSSNTKIAIGLVGEIIEG